MSRRNRFGRRLAFRAEMLAIHAVRPIIGLVPTRILIPFSGWLGAHIFVWAPIARKRIESNLDLIHPDMPRAERRALSRAVGDNFARLMAEYMRLPELARTPGLFDVEGGAHLTGAAAAGKGVVLVTAHYGNWEFVRLAAAGLGAPAAIIYRAFNNAGFDAIAQTYIAAAGTPVLHKGRKGARALLRHVIGGGAAMILIDQRQTGAPLIPFLGRVAETAPAAAALALRTGAALIPVRATRLADGRRFKVEFEAPIAHGDEVAMTRAVNDCISAWVEEHPGQWFWLHRRWMLRDRGASMRAAGERAKAVTRKGDV
jgi:KDO2-lipid IV(A) lauroyltransferase